MKSSSAPGQQTAESVPDPTLPGGGPDSRDAHNGRRFHGDSISRITVHAPRFCSNVHVLETLNGVVWLAEHTKGKLFQRQAIELLLHPVGSPWVRLIRILSDWSTLYSLLSRVVRWLVPSLAATSASGTNAAGVTIIGQVRVRYSEVSILVDEQLTIDIHRVKVGYLESGLLTLRACWRGLRHWWKCIRKGRLDLQTFLRSRYRGVQVGDLIASEAIGFNPTAGGSLQRCGALAILRGIVDAIYTVDYIYERSWSTRDYATASETTYLEELYRRTLRQQGLGILEMYDYSGRLHILTDGPQLPNSFVARARQGPPLSTGQRERAKKYLAERLNATRHLWYMNVGHNLTQAQPVVDENGCVLEPDMHHVTVVVFLHSFDDAQYQFGPDGFSDLYEWTVVTIDECLANGHVGRVLLKEHPNVDPVAFPGDKHALLRLRARYGRESRVTFVGRYTNIKAFASLGCVYGITNYGSVAEELVAAGLPAIASSNGPWGKHYPFLQVWDSPEAYRALLRGLTAECWRAPGIEEIDALAEFVHEYRLNILPGADVPLWFQCMSARDSTINILDRDILERIEQRIAELEPDSPQLVGWLRDRAKSHRVVHHGFEESASATRIAC